MRGGGPAIERPESPTGVPTGPIHSGSWRFQLHEGDLLRRTGLSHPVSQLHFPGSADRRRQPWEELPSMGALLEMWRAMVSRSNGTPALSGSIS